MLSKHGKFIKKYENNHHSFKKKHYEIRNELFLLYNHKENSTVSQKDQRELSFKAKKNINSEVLITCTDILTFNLPVSPCTKMIDISSSSVFALLLMLKGSTKQN